MSSVLRSVTAWRHSLESTLSLARELSDPDWTAPTECPKWTVKDVYAHLLEGERWMAAGHPRLPDLTSWTEQGVLAWRDTPPLAVVEELRRAYEQRRYQLARRPVDPETPAHLPMGQRSTLEQLLRIRVLDVWAHEQDVRRAVGRPGNLASPGAAVAGDLFVAALPRIVAKSAQALPGSVVRLTTRGEVSVDVAVSTDRGGVGTLVAPGRNATAHLIMSWEAYTRLSCGRGTSADHDIRLVGDRGLAERVLAHLAVTP